MGNRISRVYTRTGDDGTTGMADGSRVAKDSPVMQAIGDVDELNCCIGMLRAENLPDFLDGNLQQIQHELFSLGGELAMPEYQVINAQSVQRLEAQMDQWNKQLAPLKEFILPVGNRMMTVCHLARAVCRRTERSLVTLSAGRSIRTEVMQYINRLSDYLFVVARMLGKDAGFNEMFWEQEGEP